MQRLDGLRGRLPGGGKRRVLEARVQHPRCPLHEDAAEARPPAPEQCCLDHARLHPAGIQGLRPEPRQPPKLLHSRRSPAALRLGCERDHARSMLGDFPFAPLAELAALCLCQLTAAPLDVLLPGLAVGRGSDADVDEGHWSVGRRADTHVRSSGHAGGPPLTVWNATWER